MGKMHNYTLRAFAFQFFPQQYLFRNQALRDRRQPVEDVGDG